MLEPPRRYITPAQMGRDENREGNIWYFKEKVAEFLHSRGLICAPETPSELRCYHLLRNLYYSDEGVVLLNPDIQHGICPNPAILEILVIHVKDSKLAEDILAAFPSLEEVKEGSHITEMRGVSPTSAVK